MESSGMRDRGVALEETYFRQLESRRQARTRSQQMRAEIAAELGIVDAELLDYLCTFGITRDTTAAFEVLPLVEVAWADGDVATEERWQVLEVATRFGVELGRPAHTQLESWLARRPARDLFDAWYERTANLRPGHAREAWAALLLEGAEQVAKASGGVLGFGAVSAAEREIIERLRESLEDALEPASGSRGY